MLFKIAMISLAILHIGFVRDYETKEKREWRI